MCRPGAAGAVSGRRSCASVLVLCCLCSPALAQQRPLKPPVPQSFSASTALVQLDVLARDLATGVPVPDLKKEDFRVFDNGEEVPVAAFASGAHFDTRPVALWLVVICNAPAQVPNVEIPQALRSGSFVGREKLFRPALEQLDKRDGVGVAHWCDNGEAVLDLHPSGDKDAAVAALARALAPYRGPQDTRVGELTLQNLVMRVIVDGLLEEPQPLPVLVFLHSDYTGMPVAELGRLTGEFLRTSGMVFGIMNDGRESSGQPMGKVDSLGFFSNGERGGVLRFLADVTGGQYFKVPESMYATALESIVTQLHFRYQLGFAPRKIDGKAHRLEVELTGNARQSHGTVTLRARQQYIPVADELPSVQ